VPRISRPGRNTNTHAARRRTGTHAFALTVTRRRPLSTPPVRACACAPSRLHHGVSILETSTQPTLGFRELSTIALKVPTPARIRAIFPSDSKSLRAPGAQNFLTWSATPIHTRRARTRTRVTFPACGPPVPNFLTWSATPGHSAQEWCRSARCGGDLRRLDLTRHAQQRPIRARCRTLTRPGRDLVSNTNTHVGAHARARTNAYDVTTMQPSTTGGESSRSRAVPLVVGGRSGPRRRASRRTTYHLLAT
jgi:hypothetical protein